MEPDDGIDYPKVLAALEAKRDVLDHAILGIKVLMGASVDYAAAMSALGSGGAPERREPVTGAETKNNIVLDAHAFFGMSISDAVQKYFSIKKKPATAVELGDALINGGFASQSENFPSTVTTSLSRNPEIFVKVKRGLWGLRAWYPNYRPPAD